MIDVHYASLTSQGVQNRILYLDGHPSRYQPPLTGLNCSEQMEIGVFPLVIAVPLKVAEHSFRSVSDVVKYFSFETDCLRRNLPISNDPVFGISRNLAKKYFGNHMNDLSRTI